MARRIIYVFVGLVLLSVSSLIVYRYHIASRGEPVFSSHMHVEVHIAAGNALQSDSVTRPITYWALVSRELELDITAEKYGGEYSSPMRLMNTGITRLPIGLCGRRWRSSRSLPRCTATRSGESRVSGLPVSGSRSISPLNCRRRRKQLGSMRAKSN